MTHVHAPVLRSNSEIAAKARQFHPLQASGRTVLTTITAVFVAIGWTTGAAWFALAFSVLWICHRFHWLGQCIRYGYHKGARHNMVPNRE